MLAMGAESVEVIRPSKAPERGYHEYDYIVLEDKDQWNRRFVTLLEGRAVVDWSWVKDSLITGRALPTPDWSSY